YESARPQTDLFIPLLEELDRYDACDPLGEAIVVDFTDVPNQHVEPYSGLVVGAVAFAPGRDGADVTEMVTATTGKAIIPGLPRDYYRCLSLTLPTYLLPVSTSGGGSPTTPVSGTPSVPFPTLRINLHSDAGAVVVLLLATAGWSMAAFDSMGVRVGSAETVEPNYSQPHGGDFYPSQLSIRSPGIRRIDIMLFHPAAVLSVAVREPMAGTDRSARQAAMQSMLDRFSSAAPVLDPNRKYRLRLTTTVEEMNGNSLSTAQVEARAGILQTLSGSTCTFVEEYRFDTEGPPGDTVLTPTAASADSAPPLDTLDIYVRELVPPRGAPAFYRSYDLRVGFDADYVDEMYAMNEQSLQIALRADDGEELTVANTMGPGHQTVLRREESEWIRTLERSTCQVTLDANTVVTETVVSAQLPQGASLAPRRRYDAVLRGDPPGRTEANRPLLQWSFVSSAFLDFAEHFRLAGRVRSAAITAADGPQWVALAAAAMAAGDPWQATGDERLRRQAIEIDAFDAMIVQIAVEWPLPRALQLTALTADGKTWGVLLASPEPVDWDRVQVSLARTEVIASGSGCLAALIGIRSPSTPQIIRVPKALRVLRDADGTRALLLRVDGGSVRAFEDGAFALSTVYKRDAGPGLPVFTQRGSSADEPASITWTLPAV
ncbi:MAG: hypothetical protein LC791_19385, partial [Acidobacteria bacterium]|nr:hypothetical protein [Acidobacteriota bacterium]